MTAEKKGKQDRKTAHIPDTATRSLREKAEKLLVRAGKNFPALEGPKAEELIHELQVHQIELEMQADELRRAYLLLEESRDKYLDLYEFAPLGYLMLTEKALVTDANLTAALLLGIERKKLIHARFGKCIAEHDTDTWHRYFLDVLKQREKCTCTLTLRRGDGSTFPARLESIRNTGREGGSPTIRVAVSDITDIRQIEMALRVANKKLNLLSSIARHDINNQLLVQNMFLGLLREKNSDPALEDYLSHIMNAGSRISAMIRFTREYENIGVSTPVWQECHSLIESAAQEATLGKVRVINDVPAGFEIFADTMIARVFFNLMDNAVRYGGTITTLRFSLEESGDRYLIIGEDNGRGIPVKEKERIFERGFGRNTGFGLFLSREILSITDITIHETGEPGRGARFEITVPCGAHRVRRLPE